MRRLDQLYTRGWAEISWEELYLWYPTRSNTHRARITKTIYDDILTRWNELVDSIGRGRIELSTLNNQGLLLMWRSETTSLAELASGEKSN